MALAPTPAALLRLSVGNGSPATLPDLTAEAVRAPGAMREEALQYGPLHGIDALRDGQLRLLAEDGVRTAPDAIIVVDGGKQALEFVARAHLSPGDLVALTVPTVLTAIGIFRREGATFLPPNRGGRPRRRACRRADGRRLRGARATRPAHPHVSRNASTDSARKSGSASVSFACGQSHHAVASRRSATGSGNRRRIGRDGTPPTMV